MRAGWVGLGPTVRAAALPPTAASRVHTMVGASKNRQPSYSNCTVNQVTSYVTSRDALACGTIGISSTCSVTRENPGRVRTRRRRHHDGAAAVVHVYFKLTHAFVLHFLEVQVCAIAGREGRGGGSESTAALARAVHTCLGST